ncbi:TraR/DksA C4-type zinc finger protein [Sporomusa malonica]|uniref:Transcriptional regulator, TraR/DksA family n=1 Tax=Sporomusa malonica TaxID=112901 RepID=A0A1W2A635_9FIRM|nr:TraR/DksA C4-type zinc finger protein [Sporomusa malonica]SMC56120.1 transcriptional regulator, TraR/DksA family [Sporomusa malonica]
MRPEQLTKFKSQLEAKKHDLIHTIIELEDNGLRSALSNTTGELSTYDNHPADLGSETFERGKDLGLRDNERVLLSSVERALEKIHLGTYGRCDHCGAVIPAERLEALPWATQCIGCQEHFEQTDVTPRPLEEESLEPPFHRSFLDSARFEFVGYDGEDALQDVARYGSSDTPQDIPGSYDYKALFPNSNEHQGIVDLADAIPNEPGSTSRHARKR